MELNTNNKFKQIIQKYKASKFYQFMKKNKKWVVTCSVLLALIIVMIIPFIEVGSARGDFNHAFNDYKNKNGFDHDISFNAEFKDESKLKNISDGTTTKRGITMNVGSEVTYKVDLPNDGLYILNPTYLIGANGFIDNEFEIKINDVINKKYKIRANFKNSVDEFKKDSLGNEVVPHQDVLKKWETAAIFESSFKNYGPHKFNLQKGLNEISFKLVEGEEISLSELSLNPTKEYISYEEYIKNYESYDDGTRLITDLEGEKFSYKNDTTPIPSSLSDLNAFPYDSVQRRLNVLSNFSKTNQIVAYEFEIKTSGLYVININHKVNNSNHVTFATISIDDSIPFGELLHYPFEPTRYLEEEVLSDNNLKPFKFYFEKGIHTIKIKIDGSLYEKISNDLSSNITSLNKIYLDLKRIAGTVQDNNKEWDPDTDFPGIKEAIENIRNNLKNMIPELYKINGSNNNFQAVINLESAINAIDGILKKPKTIPNNYHKFSEGSGSIIESLSNAKEDLDNTPLDIDRIIIGTTNNHNLSNKKNSFDRFIESIKKFFISFGTDYSGSKVGPKTLDIWVARSRQYVDLMQQTFDSSDFKERTGYDVKFTILADESKLILSNAAKISPDGVMGISNWLPYEMGIRDLTVDLLKFKDYKDVISRFSPGALISLIADKRGLGLPETQDFYVQYYRKDICNEYGYDIPNTWDEMLDLLPKLQIGGRNYYIPLSSSSATKSIMTTVPFIYQYGGNLFSDDGKRTTLDEENSLNAVKFMTELYTLYGLQSQVVNFFDSFRNGSLPIGVSTFDTYVKLKLGAPEIEGLWDIAVAPGMLDNDGNIARWQTGSATSMCLVDKGEEKNNAGWELLKWWTSKEVQSEFSKNLTLLYGKGYIWNSANLEAFNESIIFSKHQKEVILNQWKWMREIPKVPGWYMLERELSNAWNKIVLKAENTRSVTENAVTIINKELTRKLIEFGYLDSKGNDIKPYHVTTIDYVNSIINGGAK